MRLIVVSILLASVALHGQAISGQVTPSAVTVGQTVAITATAIQSVTLPVPCVWRYIHQGSPTGPLVLLPFACLLSVVPLAPGQSQTGSWVANVTAGTYFFQVDWYAAGSGVLQSSFFSFEVRASNSMDPTFYEQTTPQVGQPLNMQVQAPFLPGVPYIGAASLTSDNPIPLGPFGPYTSIDPDFLFDLSFPVANPFLFSNFSGTTDTTGTASGIGMNIPNDPALTYFPLKVQMALFDPTSSLPVLTNALSLTIQP